MNIDREIARYKSVRALERGLELILALNRVGRAKPGELAAETGIDRTTVYRLLHTLASYGLVGRSPAHDSWYLLRGVHDLSNGYVENDQVLHLAARELGALLPVVQWPSDFAVFDGGAMVIQETTHRFSPFSVHRNMVGRRRSLLNSALGKAALMAAPSDYRGTMIALAEQLQGERPTNPDFLGRLQDDYKLRGYTWSVAGSEDRISAIALPILGSERVIGAINIVFFRSASTPEAIARQYLSYLQQCAAKIEASLRDIA